MPSDNGYKYVLVMVDESTGMTEVAALRRKTAGPIARAIERQWLHRYGVPRTIVSDNAAELVGSTLQELANQYGIALKRVAPHNQRANTYAERTIQTLKRVLRALARQHPTRWTQHLTSARFSFITAVSSTRTRSPFQLSFVQNPHLAMDRRFGNHADVPFDAHNANHFDRLDGAAKAATDAAHNARRARQETDKRSRNKDVRRTDRQTFNVGDVVWLLNRNDSLPGGKFGNRQQKLGPFQITHLQDKRDRALLKRWRDHRPHRVFVSLHNLRQVTGDVLAPNEQATFAPDDVVASILSYRPTCNGAQVLRLVPRNQSDTMAVVTEDVQPGDSSVIKFLKQARTRRRRYIERVGRFKAA